MNNILIPLRSNAAWFSAENTRFALERRIKNYMLIYDEIIFQNGRYHCTIVENGSIDFISSPREDTFDRSKIQYLQPGQTFRLLVGPEGSEPNQEVIGGEAIASYEVDYYPILNDAKLTNADYFKWLDGDLNDEDKKIVNNQLRKITFDETLQSKLPNNHFQRSQIIKSLYLDSMLSFRLGLPFLVDQHTAPLLQWQNKHAEIIWKLSLPDVFYTTWIALDLPDFSSLSWEKLHNIRESQAGVDYRRMIHRITESISKELPNIKDERDIRVLVTQEFSKELITEIQSSIPSIEQAIYNLSLNLTPIGTLISTIDDVMKIIEERNSWVSLLSRP